MRQADHAGPSAEVVDPSAFSIAATIDRIEFQVALEHATNPQTVLAWMAKRGCAVRYVTPIEGMPNGTATVFSFWLQEPTSPEAAAAMFAAFASRFPMAQPPAVTGLEVALDAYLKANAKAPGAIAAMAEHLFQHHAGLVGDWRVTGPVGTCKAKGTGKVARPLERLVLLRLMETGQTVVVGDMGADLTQRFYFKTRDDGGRDDLPQGEHRARCEVTLRGGAVPFETIEGWRRFDFTNLAPFFKFRRVKDGVPLVVARIRAKQVRPEATPHRHAGLYVAVKKASRGRKYSRHTVADTALNERAYDALRNLTAKQRQGAEIPGLPRAQVIDFSDGSTSTVNTLTINFGSSTSLDSSAIRKTSTQSRFLYAFAGTEVLGQLRLLGWGRFALRDIFESRTLHLVARSVFELPFAPHGVSQGLQTLRTAELSDLRQVEVEAFDSG